MKINVSQLNSRINFDAAEKNPIFFSAGSQGM